jgi:hypothetical protein
VGDPPIDDDDDSDDEDRDRDEDAEHPPEYLLAVIELGREPESEEDALVVLHYAELLDKGDVVCEQDPQDLADIAAKAWDILDEDGFDPDLRELVAVYSEAVPPEMAPMDCVEIMATAMAIVMAR